MKKVEFEGKTYVVPDRATYMARDANHMIYAYGVKPLSGLCVWFGEHNPWDYFCGICSSGINWEYSLKEI